MNSEKKQKLREIFDENGLTIYEGEGTDELLIFDSFQFISIIAEIEKIFLIDVPDDYLLGEGLDTFSDFIRLIESVEVKR